RTQSAHHPLRRGAPRARGGLVSRRAAGRAGRPPAAARTSARSRPHPLRVRVAGAVSVYLLAVTRGPRAIVLGIVPDHPAIPSARARGNDTRGPVAIGPSRGRRRLGWSTAWQLVR